VGVGDGRVSDTEYGGGQRVVWGGVAGVVEGVTHFAPAEQDDEGV